MRLWVALVLISQLLSCQSDVDISIVNDNPVVETDNTEPPAEDLTPEPTPPCTVSLELLSTQANTTGSNGQASFIIGDLGIASTEGGTEVVQIVDFSDEDNIITRGEYDPSGHGFLDLFAEGNVVYGSSISGQLHSIDISDPDNPVNLDILSIPNESWGMVSKGDYLYIGNYASGLNIIDKSNPSNLTSLNVIAGYPLMHMQINGNTLYGTTGRKIVILDISNPTAPTFLGELDLGASWMAYEFHQTGNYLYAIAKPQELLQTIDVSDPTNPTLVYTSPASGRGNDFRSIAGTTDKLFIGTGSSENGEILAYDIKNDPVEPELEDTISASNRTYEIYLKDQYIFTSNRGGQSDLFKFSCD